MITIIVLLLLAGVTIATLTGENGILSQAQSAKESTKIGRFREDAKLAYMEVYAENARNGVYVVEEAELISKLQEPQYGYTIQPEPTGGVTGITVKQNGTIVNATTAATVEKAEQGQTEPYATLTVIPASGDGTAYYIVDDGIYYEISLSGAEITIGEGQETVGGAGGSTPTLTVTNAESLQKLETEVNGLTITVVGRTAGDENITISYGGKTAEVKVTVTEAFTVNLYSNNTAEATVNAIRVASGGSAFTAEGYAVPTAPTGYKFDKWVLKTAVGDGTGKEIGDEATSYLSNVTQGLNVYATYTENKLYGARVKLNGGNEITVKTVGTTNYTIEDNWKLFYIDDAADGYVHLIYGDYYPANVQTEITSGNTIFAPAHQYNSTTKAYDTDSSYAYSVNSSTNRLTLLRYLKNNASYAEANLDTSTPAGSYDSWTNLVTALTGTGKALNGKTIRVQGAPNITMWKNSWNEQGYEELALDDSENNATGYNVRLATANANSNSNYYISLSSYSGYQDRLYFPNRGSSSTTDEPNGNKALGYWLASPGGSYSNHVCYVYCGGYVYCNYVYDNYNLSARPVVSILKSDFQSISAFSGISISK